MLARHSTPRLRNFKVAPLTLGTAALIYFQRRAARLLA